MWKRRQLKRNAKSALKANYWRCVLAALLLVCITGGMSGLAGSSFGMAGSGAGIVGQNALQMSQADQTELTEKTDAVSDIAGIAENGIGSESKPATWNDVLDLITQTPEVQAISEQLSQLDESDYFTILAVVGAVVGVILLIALLVQIFIINPLVAGCKYFFARNCEEKTMLGEVAAGFDKGYGRVVKGMFLKDLFLLFWTLLFIIPGIIKSFSYRMVPYILADQPELTATQAITRSRQMMKGNKWRAFVLDLSFILWYILSALTFGLVGFFFVHPYYEATNGELYQALKAEHSPQSFASVDDLIDDTPQVPSYDYSEDLPQDTPVQDAQTEVLPQDTTAQELPEDVSDS